MTIVADRSAIRSWTEKMDAIISDIHGNLEALNATVDAIREMGSTRIIFLGDVGGYGPDTIDCVRRSSEWDVCILGDWDAALLEHHSDQWSPTLNHHIEYLRGEVDQSPDRDWLDSIICSYQQQYLGSGVRFVHGTPDNRRDWIFPEDIYAPQKLNRIAGQFDEVCISGNSHLNGLFRRRSESEWEYVEPQPDSCYDTSAADKTIVTVGSVGQPRDNDPRACFATLDNSLLTFHRVAYDVETTIKKIQSNPNIDDSFGERLRYGR